MNNKMFYNCSLCGKRILERQENGLWRFIFGRDSVHGFAPVDMIIYGSVKMRCLRRRCRKENPDHWNVFNIFPNQDFPQSAQRRTNQPSVEISAKI